MVIDLDRGYRLGLISGRLQASLQSVMTSSRLVVQSSGNLFATDIFYILICAEAVRHKPIQKYKLLLTC